MQIPLFYHQFSDNLRIGQCKCQVQHVILIIIRLRHAIIFILILMHSTN